MNGAKRPALRPDRQLWDPANGLRVGLLAGALLGGALVAATGFESFWVVALTGATGGAVGFWRETRKRSGRAGPSEPDRGSGG